MSVTSNHNLVPGTWSAMPKSVVKSGALRRMRGCKSQIYIALVARADWSQGGRVVVSQEQLERDTGIRPRNIRKAVNDLAALGVVLVISRGCGKGNASVFRIIMGNPDASVPLSHGQTRTIDDTKPGHRGSQRRTQEVANPDASVPPLRRKKEEGEEEAHTTCVLDGEQQETVQRLLDATRRGGAA